VRAAGRHRDADHGPRCRGDLVTARETDHVQDRATGGLGYCRSSDDRLRAIRRARHLAVHYVPRRGTRRALQRSDRTVSAVGCRVRLHDRRLVRFREIARRDDHLSVR
jgi:hypothetical protein